MRGSVIGWSPLAGWAIGTAVGLGIVAVTHPGPVISVLLGYTLSSIGAAVGLVVEARR